MAISAKIQHVRLRHGIIRNLGLKLYLRPTPGAAQDSEQGWPLKRRRGLLDKMSRIQAPWIYPDLLQVWGRGPDQGPPVVEAGCGPPLQLFAVPAMKRQGKYL